MTVKITLLLRGLDFRDDAAYDQIPDGLAELSFEAHGGASLAVIYTDGYPPPWPRRPGGGDASGIWYPPSRRCTRMTNWSASPTSQFAVVSRRKPCGCGRRASAVPRCGRFRRRGRLSEAGPEARR